MALRTPLSVTPHLYMGDSTGRPLDKGVVYFGEQDKDPEFYPINLFSDDALTKPLVQPVHTKGGYLYDKGDMVEPHAKELIYSVKVLDSYGRKVFYKGAMMRNSWNDDVIEQINTAIIGSADVARRVATDLTNNAINNTAVEGGVLADTFVVVDGSLSQRNINKGLESIADLSTIKNPKDGLRVYVKSYHAGLRRGGGYFIYDSSKASINDHGNIINGWVREGSPNYLDLFNFGAVGDGVEKLYDHLAFEYISEYIKNTDYENYTINIPTPQKHYLVGLQEINEDGTLINHPILAINGTNRVLNIQIISNNAKIKFNDGLYYGTFTRNDLSVYEHEMPFYGSIKAYKDVQHLITLGNAGTMFNIAYCNRLIMKGNLELDGNRKNHILGGKWGDKGWQIASTGIRAMYMSSLNIDGVEAYDFGQDGLYLSTKYSGENVLTGDKASMSQIKNIKSYRNSRQGFSITGGSNINIEDCLAYMNGHPSLEFISSPASNMDIEAERAKIRNLHIRNFVSYLGEVIADSGDSEDITFTNCKFIAPRVNGSALWISRKKVKFFNCYVNGQIRKTVEGIDIKEGEQTYFKDCHIEMNSNTHPSGSQEEYYGNHLFEGNGHFVVKDSLITLEQGGITYGRSSSAANYIIGSVFENVIIELIGTPRLFILPDYMKNVEIRDQRVDTTVKLIAYVDNAYIENVYVTSKQETSNIVFTKHVADKTWSASSSNIKTKLADNIANMGVVQIAEYKATKPTVDRSTTIKVSYSSTLNIGEGYLNNVGDRVYCTDPNKNIDYWVCTKAGDGTEDNKSEWKAINAVAAP